MLPRSRYILPSSGGGADIGEIDLAALSVITIDDPGGDLVGSPTYHPDGSIELTIAAGPLQTPPDGIRILVTLERDSLGTSWPADTVTAGVAFSPAMYLRCEETSQGSIADNVYAGGGFAARELGPVAAWADVDYYMIGGLQSAPLDNYQAFTLVTGGTVSRTVAATTFGVRQMRSLSSGGALLAGSDPTQLRIGRWGQVNYDDVETRANDVFNSAVPMGFYTVGVIYVARADVLASDETLRFKPAVFAHLIDLGF